MKKETWVLGGEPYKLYSDGKNHVKSITAKGMHRESDFIKTNGKIKKDSKLKKPKSK